MQVNEPCALRWSVVTNCRRRTKCSSPLQAQSEQHRCHCIGNSLHIGAEPIFAHRAFELHLAIELVGDPQRSEIAVVGARQTDIVVAAIAQLRGTDEPEPEGVIDLR